MTTSTNYWINRIEEDGTIDHAFDRVGTYRDAPLELTNDTTWRVIMVVMWFVMTAAVAYKTLPGGIAALPTFLVLDAMCTTLIVLGWVKVGK